jgi:hypothetical protein
MNFPGGGGGGIPGIPSGGAPAGNVPPGFDPNDPNVKWVCPCPVLSHRWVGLVSGGD